MDGYRYKSTEALVKLYADEAGRKNQDDAERTKALIKKELKRRFNAFLDLLDDEQTAENPAGTIDYLLGNK